LIRTGNYRTGRDSSPSSGGQRKKESAKQTSTFEKEEKKLILLHGREKRVTCTKAAIKTLERDLDDIQRDARSRKGLIYLRGTTGEQGAGNPAGKRNDKKGIYDNARKRVKRISILG